MAVAKSPESSSTLMRTCYFFLLYNWNMNTNEGTSDKGMNQEATGADLTSIKDRRKWSET